MAAARGRGRNRAATTRPPTANASAEAGPSDSVPTPTEMAAKAVQPAARPASAPAARPAAEKASVAYRLPRDRRHRHQRRAHREIRAMVDREVERDGAADHRETAEVARDGVPPAPRRQAREPHGEGNEGELEGEKRGQGRLPPATMRYSYRRHSMAPL